MTATTPIEPPPKPAPPPTPDVPEIVHEVCSCSLDIALCGLNVKGHRWSDDDISCTGCKTTTRCPRCSTRTP